MDILGRLPLSHRGNKYVLVVTDYLTPWSPNQEPVTVARILVDEWICWFGGHGSYTLIRVPIKEVCELLGVEKTTLYHLQTNGVVERLNRSLFNTLSIHITAGHHSRDEHLSTSMRTSVHASTDSTPLKLMFGREVHLPVEFMFGMPPSSPQSASGYAQKLKQDLLTAYDDARARISLVKFDRWNSATTFMQWKGTINLETELGCCQRA